MCNVAALPTTSELQTQLGVAYHFPSPIYLIDKPDFLQKVTEVSDENLQNKRKDFSEDNLYPVVMSNNFYADPRVLEFAQFVGLTAWNILQEQGYHMEDKVMTFLEMWTQEHHKRSAMEQHTHNGGAQIVGFYFLEVPENSSRVVFHDPRIAKTMIDLPQSDQTQATIASSLINFEPRPGLLIFSNAWLAHSFTRHGSDMPLKFVHFNLAVQQSPIQTCPAPAEVI